MSGKATMNRSWRLALAAAFALTWAWPGSSSAIIVQVDSIKGRTTSFTPNKRLVGQTANADDDTVRRAINIADCDTYVKADKPEITVTWTWMDMSGLLAMVDARWTVKIAPPGQTCNVEELEKIDAESKCKLLTNTSKFNLSAKGQQVHINVKDLIGDTKCDSKSDLQAKVYFLIKHKPVDRSGFGSATTVESTIMNVTIDLQAPDAPKITSVNPGGQSLKVAWDHAVADSSMGSRIYWSSVSFDSAKVTQASHSEKVSATSYHITSLTNGQEYFVGVTAVDENDNESAGSNVETGMPIQVQDLWQYYKASGGSSEAGYYGCSAGQTAGGGGGWLLLGALAGLLLWRRRRASLRGLALLALVAVVQLPAWTASASSPRTASIDARMGLYEPQIDSEFSGTTGATPYNDLMADSAWAKSFNIDWRILHGFGELGAGMGFSWWTQDGTSKSIDGSATDDKNQLMVVPVTLDLVYRFDVLAKKWNFPLIPYARGGVVYAFWWSFDGTDNVSVYKDAAGKSHRGEGGVAGLHWTAGLRLLLDVFEPQAAKSFDIELGVNHSYLFAEFQRMSINNFGDPKAFDLSDDIVWFGLAFDI